MQLRGDRFKRFLCLFVFRGNAFHGCPESGGVVHLLEVGQLMADDVVDDVWRGLYQAPVQAYFFLAVATAPA